MDPVVASGLIKPGFLIVTGAALLWFPHRYRQNAQRVHAARLAELDAGADERYFEERRSLETYQPAKRDLTWRLFGCFVLLLGTYQAYSLLVG